MIPTETARLCIRDSGGATGPLGADSSGIETAGYEKVQRPDNKEYDFVQNDQKEYWKYHITAILGLQIILAAICTPGNTSDTTMIPTICKIGHCQAEFNLLQG